jgi:hypothetical protein
VLPVDEKILHTHASPRAAVGFLIHAAGLLPERLGARINLTMPGVSCTVAEQIAALRRIAGDNVAARIRREPIPWSFASSMAGPIGSMRRVRARLGLWRSDRSKRSSAFISRTSSAA